MAVNLDRGQISVRLTDEQARASSGIDHAPEAHSMSRSRVVM